MVLSDGEYSIRVDGQLWLRSSPPNHLQRKLKPLRIMNSTGSDELGAYEAIVLDWSLANGKVGSTVLSTVFRAYIAPGAELVSFTQQWPAGVNNTSVYYNKTTSMNQPLGNFPSFHVGNITPLEPTSSSSSAPELNWFAFSGNQLQDTQFGRWARSGPGCFRSNGAQNTMPLVLYNRYLRSIAVSPASHFFNAVHEVANGTFAAGPMASLLTIPAGFKHTTVVTGGRSINSSMTRLGATLLTQAGKIPVDPLRNSFALSHLGYWVDNGAPYYHTRAAYNLSVGMEECSQSQNCTQVDAP